MLAMRRCFRFTRTPRASRRIHCQQNKSITSQSACPSHRSSIACLAEFAIGAAIATVLAVVPVTGNAMAQPRAEIGTVFGNSCAGCHPAGGNALNRKKTLKKGALEDYGYADKVSV